MNKILFIVFMLVCSLAYAKLYYKCDICGKDTYDYMHIEISHCQSVDLCCKCGKIVNQWLLDNIADYKKYQETYLYISSMPAIRNINHCIQKRGTKK